MDEPAEPIAVSFPEPNPFVPKDLELKERPTSKEDMPKFPQVQDHTLYSQFFAVD